MSKLSRHAPFAAGVLLLSACQSAEELEWRVTGPIAITPWVSVSLELCRQKPELNRIRQFRHGKTWQPIESTFSFVRGDERMLYVFKMPNRWPTLSHFGFQAVCHFSQKCPMTSVSIVTGLEEPPPHGAVRILLGIFDIQHNPIHFIPAVPDAEYPAIMHLGSLHDGESTTPTKSGSLHDRSDALLQSPRGDKPGNEFHPTHVTTGEKRNKQLRTHSDAPTSPGRCGRCRAGDVLPV